MPRNIKKVGGEGTDFSITDAAKRARMRRRQLDAAAGVEHNKIDDINQALEDEGMSEFEKDVFGE